MPRNSFTTKLKKIFKLEGEFDLITEWICTVISRLQTSPNLSGDVCSTLFGPTSILTLTGMEVKLGI